MDRRNFLRMGSLAVLGSLLRRLPCLIRYGELWEARITNLL